MVFYPCNCILTNSHALYGKPTFGIYFLCRTQGHLLVNHFWFGHLNLKRDLIFPLFRSVQDAKTGKHRSSPGGVLYKKEFLKILQILKENTSMEFLFKNVISNINEVIRAVFNSLFFFIQKDFKRTKSTKVVI